VRVTWAVHARDLRLERETADGFVRSFPRRSPSISIAMIRSSCSSNWKISGRTRADSTRVRRGDSQDLVRRILAAAPGYVEAILEQLAQGGRLSGAASVRVHTDAVVLARVLARFLREKELESHPETRFTRFHLRKLVWRASWTLVRERVGEERLAAWLASPAAGSRRASPRFTERELIQALAGDDDDEAAPLVLALAERAFHRWLEDTCLDDANEAFESEGSPFASREEEVLAVVSIVPQRRLRRVAHLAPFLCRAGSRDCLRLLRALEVWFLRQYDVPRACGDPPRGEPGARA
jgi:hypothetical protein